MGLLHFLFGSRQPTETDVPNEPIHLAPGDDFDFEIVGEANYQSALNDLCGGKCEEGHELEVTAQLCFQDDNPYDANAVVVLINRKIVGYIPRDKAPGIRAEILRLNPDERPVTCDAIVVGGWNRSGRDQGHYGVRLSLAEPLQRDRLT